MELSLFEMLLVALIAFCVLGPKELVLSAQKLGRVLGRWRTQWENLKIMAEEEAQLKQVKDLQREMQEPHV
jgi:Sec-independent protein translocase protein TatA